MLPPNSAALEYALQFGGMPELELPDGTKVRPKREYLEQELRWRWLLDSLEGGERYRQAVYGMDLRGMPIRNLIRHKREYPLPQDGGLYSPSVGRPTGTDQAAQATDDDYELRRARTPIPTFTLEVVTVHLAKIYNQEIKREGPEPIEGWWKDMDGLGSSADQWWGDVAGPLLMVFGQLDVKVENAAAPDGEEVATRADELRLGLDKAVVSYILPVNLPWWKLDRRGRYVECVVREVGEDDEIYWRYWNADEWVKYGVVTVKDRHGKESLAIDVVDRSGHPYGVVPIVRVFDKRRPSCQHVGLPRYEPIAEIQREFYNRSSELILSDTTQAHPVLQMPEDMLKPDGTVGIGPGYVLPMKRNPNSGDYAPSSYVDPPKGAADSLRTNMSDLRDEADRQACLTKPAGSAGTTGQTVGQSGLSKRLDQTTGNELLGKIAKTLQHAEETVSELAAVVLGVASPERGGEAFSIGYPGQFDLANADELMGVAQAFELLLTQAGDAPITELAMLSKAVRLIVPGLDDDQYGEMDDELEALLARRQQEKREQRESMQLALDAPPADEPNHEPAGTSAPGDQPDEGE